MKTCLILLEDGFEECEALITHDILTRSGHIKVDLVGNKEIVTTSMGVKIHTNKLLKDVITDEYDFMVLPGGKLGVDNISSNKDDIAFIKEMISKGKHVHAICAAPSILVDIKYLNDKNFTCYPGFQRDNKNWQNKGSVIDKNTVTGRSMGYSIEFAKNIVRLEVNEQCLAKIDKGIFGLE